MEIHIGLIAVAGRNPNWFRLAMGLLGGLALFLYGLDQLSSGLKQAAGDSLKTLLTRLTKNRFLGAFTGALITGILNSSTVTTVLVVGFVTAGLMTLTQSVAVIMGANVGSTVTAQILAFDLTAYAFLPVAVGFFMLFVGKRDVIHNWGMMIMGLGLVFYGMGVMGDTMRPLRSYPPFIHLLASMAKPLYGIIAGMLFTAVVQSSAATLGLAIALAGDGLLTLPAAIPLVLGAQIGTCLTALFAALGKPADALRAAMVHVLFNILGVILWFPFIGLLAKLAIAVSPGTEAADGSVMEDVPRQIANANTLFNVINTAIFIWFTGAFASLATRLVPDRTKPEAQIKPRYLDASSLSLPALALEQVRQELARIGERVHAMLKDLEPQGGTIDPTAVKDIQKRAGDVDVLQMAVLEFLGKIREGNLMRQESQIHIALMTIAVHYREMSDLIAENLLGAVQTAVGDPTSFAKLEVPLLGELYRAVLRASELAIRAIRDQDAAVAKSVLDMSSEIRKLGDTLMSRLAEGMQMGDPGTLSALRLQTTFVDALRHVFTLTKRIARSAAKSEHVETEGA